MPKDTREPQEILAHVISSRVALTSAIYGLSETDLAKAGAVGHWSVKDIMAHLGRWEEVCFDELQIHLRGDRSNADYRDALAYNEKWEPELQALSLWASGTGSHCAVHPQSIVKALPVIPLASSEQRYVANFATSSGSSRR